MTAGEIVWGVKSSFIRYVRTSGGTIEFDGGAWADESDRFHFSLASGADDGTDAVRAAGSVRLRAHGGLLDLIIADPRVDRSGDRIELSVRLGEASERTVIAELRPSSHDDWSGDVRWIDVETRLTEAGADAIDPLHYFAGQRVDGVDLVIPTGDGVPVKVGSERSP